RRRSRAEVEQLVREYDTSGLGRQEFCEKHGLSLSTLNRHRKRKQMRTETGSSGRLIPVEVSQAKRPATSSRCGELLVWLASGRSIEVRGGFDPKVLQQLVRVLEQA
ncbi:MAG TPA: hypothetical protein VH229_12930, partial [Candidatus Udaeobacter sp.]|nr:hypothetical protein [Candidatus Udaeobacter sp.]